GSGSPVAGTPPARHCAARPRPGRPGGPRTARHRAARRSQGRAGPPPSRRRASRCSRRTRCAVRPRRTPAVGRRRTGTRTATPAPPRRRRRGPSRRAGAAGVPVRGGTGTPEDRELVAQAGGDPRGRPGLTAEHEGELGPDLLVDPCGVGALRGEVREQGAFGVVAVV